MMECIPSLSITFYTFRFGRHEKIALFRYEIPKQWNDIFIPFCSTPLHSTLFRSVRFSVSNAMFEYCKTNGAE